MKKTMMCGHRAIGIGQPVFIVAELSGNHNQDFDRAAALIEAAAEAGADGIKIQTYTADTLTIDSNEKSFVIGDGTIWQGRTLFDLYSDAYTPWEWQPKLMEIAQSLGLEFFSTPFDETAVDFLEAMNVPIYKIASFEIVDIPLLKSVGKTGKPVILSTGMASISEIGEAIETLVGSGSGPIALLKCTSAYPASPEDANLRTLSDMRERFDTLVGLSDHTIGLSVPIAAVSLGACIVEKHFTLSRDDGGPDSDFSLQPSEFAEMVRGVRQAEMIIGEVKYGTQDSEKPSLVFRKSLFIVEDIEEGEVLTRKNTRCIRPGYGLHPRHLEEVIGRKVKSRIRRGTPLRWEVLA